MEREIDMKYAANSDSFLLGLIHGAIVGQGAGTWLTRPNKTVIASSSQTPVWFDRFLGTARMTYAILSLLVGIDWVERPLFFLPDFFAKNVASSTCNCLPSWFNAKVFGQRSYWRGIITVVLLASGVTVTALKLDTTNKHGDKKMPNG